MFACLDCYLDVSTSQYQFENMKPVTILFDKQFFIAIAAPSRLETPNPTCLFLVFLRENSFLGLDLRTFKNKTVQLSTTSKVKFHICFEKFVYKRTKGLFWKKLTFHSLFIWVLINRASVSMLFVHITYMYNIVGDRNYLTKICLQQYYWIQIHCPKRPAND